MPTNDLISVCERFLAKPLLPAAGSRLGIALDTLSSLPIHGMRIEPTEGTNGWYLWCGGEPSSHDDFYAPLCIEHLGEYLPQALEYMSLPPGYRFVIDNSGYEDVWFDSALLGARQ